MTQYTNSCALGDVATVRTYLGRYRFAANDVVDWLVSAWQAIPEYSKSVIRADIEDALNNHDAASVKTKLNHRDRPAWERASLLWRNHDLSDL